MPSRNISEGKVIINKLNIIGLKLILLRMLDKDPKMRITVDQLKKETWLNDGFAVSLDSEDADIFANYTDEELKYKGIPLH